MMPLPASTPDAWPESMPSGLAAEILEQAHDVIAMVRPDGTLLYLNRAGRALLALPEGPIPEGLTLAGFQPEWAWLTVSLEGLPTALEEGIWTAETAVRRVGGADIPMRQILRRIGDGAAGVLVSVMRDLTEAKRRDVERMEFMNRYETAIRMSGHVLLDWDPFTLQLACSGDLAGLLGSEPGEFGSNLDRFRERIHPSDLAGFDREVKRTVTTRDSLAVVFRVQQRDGDYRSVRAAGGYYLDRDGRLGRITALLSDAELLRSVQLEAERLRTRLELSVEDQVKEARQEAEQARQAKSEFLSRMSHELRTPLNAILGFAQLLELEGPSEAQKESIDHISRAGHHLLTLINEVLDLSRVESGRMALHFDTIPVAACLNELIEVVRPAADRARITLLANISALPSWRISADPQRLRQVLSNLLANAVKFNRSGGSVTVQCMSVGDARVRISITDTGPGISPDHLDRLFTPLEKYGGAAELGGGTGLSLALARGIIQAMHGDLGVETIEGVGSTFWLELPLFTEDSPTSIVAESPPGDGVIEPARERNLQRVKVLYVEDEELNLQLVRRVLTDYPEYTLVTTMLGATAVPLAREHQPALILLDLNLPDVSGEAVLAALKDDPSVRDIPVIMITADIVGHRLERLLAGGARAYLTKPFKIVDLIRIIRDTLAADERRKGAVV